MVGGQQSVSSQTDEILEYDPDNEAFIQRSERMGTSRYAHAVIFVDDSVVNCS